VRNAYPQPERLGVDRFLALVAAHAEVPGAVVVASCGTAFTLDALDGDGRHLGGLLAPSPESMQAALYGAAARLGAPTDGKIVEFADQTADAIVSGCWFAAAALTERFVARVTRRLAVVPELFVSGGSAERLATLLERPHRLAPQLVLQGLARLADAAD
jgi:type III pantothenate kinase